MPALARLRPALPACQCNCFALLQSWSKEQQEYIDSLKDSSKWGGKPYSARYIGSLVGDFHRTLLYGEQPLCAVCFLARQDAELVGALLRGLQVTGCWAEAAGQRQTCCWAVPQLSPCLHGTALPKPQPNRRPPLPSLSRRHLRLPRRRQEPQRQAAPAVRVRPHVHDLRAGGCCRPLAPCWWPVSIALLGTYPDERPLCRRQLARIVALALRLLIKLRASLSVHCSPALPFPTPHLPAHRRAAPAPPASSACWTLCPPR